MFRIYFLMLFVSFVATPVAYAEGESVSVEVTQENSSVISSEVSVVSEPEIVVETKPEEDNSSSFEAVSEEPVVSGDSTEVFTESDSLQSLSSKNFLELGVEYPINFGLHFRYLLLENIYARFGFGFMSKFFLDSFSKVAPSLGFLNAEESKILSDTFQNSMYLDFRLGWIPYFKQTRGGPYIELGLSGALLGKGELGGQTLSQVLPNSGIDEEELYSAKTNAYNATLHIGYQIPFDKLKLNLELGIVKVLRANIVDLSEEQREISNRYNLTDQQKKDFQSFLWKRAWIFPTASAWISFSF